MKLLLRLVVLLIGTNCLAAAPPDPLAAEREAVWNSPEMLQSRGWLTQYFAASKKHTKKDAQQYLDRLHAATPEQMRAWLADFHARRQRQVVEQQQAGAQRQWAVSNTFATQRAQLQQLAAQQAAAAAQTRALQAQLEAQRAAAIQLYSAQPAPNWYDDRTYGFSNRTLAILNFLDTQAIREELQQREQK